MDKYRVLDEYNKVFEGEEGLYPVPGLSVSHVLY